MDSLQPILPTERLRIHGSDRSWDGKVKAAYQRRTNIRILDQQITKRTEEMVHGLRWLEGAHPQLGEVIQGKNGAETVQKFTEKLQLDMQN